MQPWLIALVLKPYLLLVLFTSVAFIAYKVIHPLMPDGPLKQVLFDRTIQQRHPWKFALCAMGASYGCIAAIYVWVSYFR